MITTFSENSSNFMKKMMEMVKTLTQQNNALMQQNTTLVRRMEIIEEKTRNSPCSTAGQGADTMHPHNTSTSASTIPVFDSRKVVRIIENHRM